MTHSLFFQRCDNHLRNYQSLTQLTGVGATMTKYHGLHGQLVIIAISICQSHISKVSYGCLSRQQLSSFLERLVMLRYTSVPKFGGGGVCGVCVCNEFT